MNLHSLGPEPSASANSATSAYCTFSVPDNIITIRIKSQHLLTTRTTFIMLTEIDFIFAFQKTESQNTRSLCHFRHTAPFFLFFRKLFGDTAAAVAVAVFTVGTADALSSVFL